MCQLMFDVYHCAMNTREDQTACRIQVREHFWRAGVCNLVRERGGEWGSCDQNTQYRRDFFYGENGNYKLCDKHHQEAERQSCQAISQQLSSITQATNVQTEAVRLHHLGLVTQHVQETEAHLLLLFNQQQNLQQQLGGPRPTPQQQQQQVQRQQQAHHHQQRQPQPQPARQNDLRRQAILQHQQQQNKQQKRERERELLREMLREEEEAWNGWLSEDELYD